MTGAAIYARCSTDRQDLEGQVRELEAEAARIGLPVVSRYLEKVSATGRVDRAEYDRLLRDASAPDRPWDSLLVWALDRFSRSEKFTEATAAILDLERLGVRFRSLKEPTLDTPDDGTPNLGRDVLLALLPVISSFESKRRGERVRVAMAEIRSGRRQARGKLGPAFKVDLAAIRKAEALRGRGEPWAVIAHRLGIKTETIRSAVFKQKHGLRAFPEALVPKGPAQEAVRRPGPSGAEARTGNAAEGGP
jgi:DNA invertase Pin-like site-specific DNA recombinase